MHVVTITFALNGLADDEFRATVDEIAPAFTRIPGLLAKVWLADAPRAVYGGIYVFASAAAADAYLDSEPFTAGVRANPRFAGLAVRRADTLDGPTALTAPALFAAVA